MYSAILFLAIGFMLGTGLAFVLSKNKFIADLVSANESTVNFGAVAAGLALLASIGWVSWVVYKTNAIPNLNGISLFIGTMYGISKIRDIVGTAKGTATGQDGFSKLGPMALLLLLTACGALSLTGHSIPTDTHPLDSVTKQGAPVEEVTLPATMDRKDAPVGIDPDNVVHIEDKKTGEEVWVSKSGFLGLGKLKAYQTKTNEFNGPSTQVPKKPFTGDLYVNKAKSSRKWLWILAGVVGFFALLSFGSRALTSFFGFNPIAAVGGLIGRLFKRAQVRDGVYGKKVEAKVEEKASTIVQREKAGLLSWLKEKIGW